MSFVLPWVGSFKTHTTGLHLIGVLHIWWTPYRETFLVQGCPQILWEFPGAFPQWTDSGIPWGTDNLWLRLLLDEDLKPQGEPARPPPLLERVRDFPSCPLEGSFPPSPFSFWPFSNLTLVLLRQLNLSGQGSSPVLSEDLRVNRLDCPCL